MPVQNADVAEVFERVANLLEIQDANEFRVRAYRNASRTVSSLARDIADMVEKDEDLTELAGIGEDLAGKIEEIVETGTLEQLLELEKELPGELNDLMRIDTLGPKKIHALYTELGIEDMADLRAAAEDGKIREVKGFGEKTEQKILDETARLEDAEDQRTPLIEAEQRAAPLMDYLKKSSGVKQLELAGSFRRRKETVGDLDILAACKQDSDIMERFVDFEDVEEVISHGKTKSSVVLRGDLQVDLRVVPKVAFGAALHYFTGAKAHNIAVRKIGVKKDLKINEYGVFKDEERIAGETEEEVFEQVDLPYIEPELRQDRGEIEAAREDRLPNLITLDDIRGDLQSHTDETDGRATLEEMAEAAGKLGYDYLAVTDHSKNVTMAKGMDAERLAKQIDAIDRFNDGRDGVRILKGCEVDILKDGSLDLPDDILKRLDLTVCSIHYSRNLSRKKQTERVLRAMDNPHFNIFGHPTGRLVTGRPPYDIDLEKIMEAAKERGCIMELNAHPKHLDLSDRQCRMAMEMGVMLVISTDAHHPDELNFMRCGVEQARRGWLEPENVLNTRSWAEARKLLKRD
jgi:DNA polymerase (family X)